MASRPSEPLSPFTGALPFAAALAAVAGYLDAISIARLTGTFVAFQSGNTVLFGLRLGQGEWARAWPPAAAVFAYVAGSVLAVWVIRTGPEAVAAAQRRLLTGTAVLLLVTALLVLLTVGPGSDRPTGALRYAVIVSAAVAMALQTPVVRVVRDVPVASTFSSGMLTRFGQAISDGAWRVARPREMPVLAVLAALNGAFLAGAIVAGALLELWGNRAVVVPVVVLAALIVTRRRSP